MGTQQSLLAVCWASGFTIPTCRATGNDLCQQLIYIEIISVQAEYDEMLIECGGEILPILAEKLKENFLPYFRVCLPSLISKLVDNFFLNLYKNTKFLIIETVDNDTIKILQLISN